MNAHPAPRRYQLERQLQSSCMLHCVMNLDRALEGPKLNAPAYTQRESLGRSWPAIRDFSLCNKALIKNPKSPFAQFYNNFAKSAIDSNHRFDNDKPLHKRYADEMRDGANAYLTPYSFTSILKNREEMQVNQNIDRESEWMARPLFLDEHGKFQCYNPDTGKYEELKPIGKPLDGSKCSIDSSSSDQPHLYLSVPRPLFKKVRVSESQLKALGLRSGSCVSDLGENFKPHYDGSFKVKNALTGKWEKLENEGEHLLKENIPSADVPKAPSHLYIRAPYCEETSLFQKVAISKEQLEFLSLQSGSQLYGYPKLGAKCLYAKSLGYLFPAAGNYDQDGNLVNKRYAYGPGLYHFMLFTMGVDLQGNPIDENHKHFPAFQDLHKTMRSFKDHPWSVKHFKKENLFEWQLTQVLKANKTLGEQAKNLVKSLFQDFKSHRELDQLQDSQGKPLSDRRATLPSDELMDAYYISKYLYWLWGAARNPATLMNLLEQDACSEEEAQGMKALFKTLAEQSGLLAFFQKALPEVFKRTKDRTTQKRTFFSFHGHGTIYSWDKDWQALQKQKIMADTDLADSLQNLVVLDSCYKATEIHQV